jgi:diadenosine tetraphosphate (Ap4A) HIT family hydrolase
MTDFRLDPRLAAESHPLGTLSLCEVLLFDDARFPWLVLVPRKEHLVEIIDLSDHERTALMDDITDASRALKEITRCHKLNVAALGNQVRQLHVHVIARFENDAAWAGPVWGKGARVPYEPKVREDFANKLKAALDLG